jgi:hypothetical protein
MMNLITYFHVPLIILGVCGLLLPMWRFWTCIDRMGFMREVAQRAPTLLAVDIVAAIFAFMPVVMAAADWLDSSMSSTVTAFISVLCISASVFILNQSGERISPRWAGARESALRTVAALRIIDAAELAHALQYVQARETANASRVIDAKALREVRK